jgi:hypothetical protein
MRAVRLVQVRAYCEIVSNPHLAGEQGASEIFDDFGRDCVGMARFAIGKLEDTLVEVESQQNRVRTSYNSPSHMHVTLHSMIIAIGTR